MHRLVVKKLGARLQPRSVLFSDSSCLSSTEARCEIDASCSFLTPKKLVKIPLVLMDIEAFLERGSVLLELPFLELRGLKISSAPLLFSFTVQYHTP